jgi:hypothetical protein
MVVLVVLLWACSIVPGSCAIPGELWLPTLRERLEQAQRAVELEQTQRAVEIDHTLRAIGRLKPLTARDAERQNSSGDGRSCGWRKRRRTPTPNESQCVNR